MHLVSCTNTYRDVSDLVNHGMVKNTKTWISWELNIIFLRNKKIINLCFRWHILRSFWVTFKGIRSVRNFDHYRYCSKCKEHRTIAKKFDIWKLPPILVCYFLVTFSVIIQSVDIELYQHILAECLVQPLVF